MATIALLFLFFLKEEYTIFYISFLNTQLSHMKMPAGSCYIEIDLSAWKANTFHTHFIWYLCVVSTYKTLAYLWARNSYLSLTYTYVYVCDTLPLYAVILAHAITFLPSFFALFSVSFLYLFILLTIQIVFSLHFLFFFLRISTWFVPGQCAIWPKSLKWPSQEFS